MQRNIKILLAVLIVIAVVVSIGLYFYTNRLQTNNLSTVTNTNQNTNLGDVNFQIISKLPEYSIKENSFNKDLLIKDLNKLGLFPFTNLAYIGEPRADGTWNKDIRTVSPQTVVVILYPYKDLESDANLSKRSVFVLNDTNNKPLVNILAGHLNGSEFDLPIYINADGYKNFKGSVSTDFSQQVLLALFINFQYGPLSVNTNYYQLIEDKIGRTDDLFKLN